MEINAEKFFSPPNGRWTQALSHVSSVAFLCQADRPVRLWLADQEGQLVPLGQIPPFSMMVHKLELKFYTGLLFEVERDDQDEPGTFYLQLDVRHKVGEPVSSTPMAHSVASVREVSQREKTRRIVLQTLSTLGVMPDEDQIGALETTLGFDFEEDEFGDYLEYDQDEPDPGPDPDPSPAPDPGPDPDPVQ